MDNIIKGALDMEEILKKITSYNIFNYLLPGTVFAIVGDTLTSFPLTQDDLLIALFLYYFFGLIISRVGSVVIQPILEGLRIVNPAPYSRYLSASKVDKKIDELSESNNVYRTTVSLFVLLLGITAYEKVAQRFDWTNEIVVPVVLVLMLLLFVLAYRKQTKYIVKRINKARKEDD